MNVFCRFLIHFVVLGGLLGQAGFAADEPKKEDPPKKQSRNLPDAARSKEQPREKSGKVYTNQDLKTAKGNIATSSLSGKPVADESDTVDDPGYSGEAERRLEVVRELETALTDLDTARHMQRQAQESLAGLTDRLLAAVGDAEKLRNIRQEKELLEKEAAYWADRVRQAERRLDALKREMTAKGQPTDLIDQARERLKKQKEGEAATKEGGTRVRSIGG